MSPFCPHCRSEYRQGFKTCSDCGTDLVEDLPPVADNKEETGAEMVSVFDAPDQMSALAVSALLDENGIRATIKSEQIPMYDGVAMMLFPKWGQVMVLENQLDKAKELIEQFMAGVVIDEEETSPDK
jgi:hypothetical protein